MDHISVSEHSALLKLEHEGVTNILDAYPAIHISGSNRLKYEGLTVRVWMHVQPF